MNMESYKNDAGCAEEIKKFESLNKMWKFQNQRLQETNDAIRREIGEMKKLCGIMGVN